MVFIRRLFSHIELIISCGAKDHDTVPDKQKIKNECAYAVV